MLLHILMRGDCLFISKVIDQSKHLSVFYAFFDCYSAEASRQKIEWIMQNLFMLHLHQNLVESIFYKFFFQYCSDITFELKPVPFSLESITKIDWIFFSCKSIEIVEDLKMTL